jgi:hypothetical protein
MALLAVEGQAVDALSLLASRPDLPRRRASTVAFRATPRSADQKAIRREKRASTC